MLWARGVSVLEVIQRIPGYAGNHVFSVLLAPPAAQRVLLVVSRHDCNTAVERGIYLVSNLTSLRFRCCLIPVQCIAGGRKADRWSWQNNYSRKSWSRHTRQRYREYKSRIRVDYSCTQSSRQLFVSPSLRCTSNQRRYRRRFAKLLIYF